MLKPVLLLLYHALEKLKKRVLFCIRKLLEKLHQTAGLVIQMTLAGVAASDQILHAAPKHPGQAYCHLGRRHAAPHPHITVDGTLSYASPIGHLLVKKP